MERGIKEAAQQCVGLFTRCLEIPPLMENEWAENRLADMNLWISGTGACARGRASLDSRLASRPEAHDVIVNLLRLLSTMIDECLKQSKIQDVSHISHNEEDPASSENERQGRAFSPWSDDSSSDGQLMDRHELRNPSRNLLYESMYDIELMMDQLSRIAVAIRRSVRRSRLQKADQLFNASEHQKLEGHLVGMLLCQLNGRIQERDPSQLNEVQLRLVHCNLKRRNRFLYSQRHAMGLDAGYVRRTPVPKPAGSAQKETPQESPCWESSNNSPMHANNTVITGTSASGLSDDFHLSQSRHTVHQKDHAISITSSAVSTTAREVDYPRPPQLKDDARLFRCPCCCEALPAKMTDEIRWRKHIEDDLSPYTCVLASCDQPYVLFNTEDSWRQHMLKDHNSMTYWTCFACGDGKQFSRRKDFVQHTKFFHAATVPLAHIPVLVELSKKTIPSEIRHCPLCNWPKADEVEVEKDALLNHIAKEVHSFSLRALPWADDNGQEIDENIYNSSEKVYDWLDSEGDAAEEDDENAYNIRHESLPQEPIYDIRLQNALRAVRSELTSLTQIMSGNALAHDNTSDLSKLYEKTREASRLAYPATRTVGFIGDSGVGKSSLINSLLDQEGLARSSGDGAACTTVVTEFRSVNDTYPENYTVVADFMDNDEIRELLEELLSSIRKYYTEAFREVRTSEEQENIIVAAKRAWDTLKSLFPHERNLDIDFLAQEGDEAVAAIMRTLLEWAMAGLDTRPGGRDNLQYTVVSHHADQCMKHLDRLMANDDDGNNPALWPFVKLVRVYLRSPVLRTGLVLADLPGFRDLNYARVRATERYLRHSCDEVFIVSNIMRCTTDQSIGDIIRRCARGQPIRIVCTRSEDVNSEETARTAAAADAVRIRNMNNQIRQLDSRIMQIGTRRRKAHGSRMQSLAAEESNLRDQKETLELQLMKFLVIRRNTSVTNSLLHAWGDMARILCVSNKLYSDHREDDPRQANEYLALSGIQELRRYCQSVPADAQFRATVSYLQHEVPALLGSITQWVLAGTSSMTMARAEVLRRVLTEAESTLKGSTTRDGSHVHSLQSSLRRKFSDAITQQIRRSRLDWRDDAVEASLEWANWHHMTYAAFCRNYGTYETAKQPYRCWNEEILGSGIDQLSLAWDSVLNWLGEEGKKIEDEISRIFQGVHDSIHEQRDLAPENLGNLLLNLRMRRTCILDAVHCSIERLIDDTEKIMDDTVSGHASSYIAGVMRPVYNHCMQQSGTGSDSRRKQTMNRHLSSRSLFQDFADNIALDYEEMIDEAFEQLNQKLSEEVATITRDLHATVTVEGEISEAGQHPECTEGVKRGVETCQTALANAQTIVLGLS